MKTFNLILMIITLFFGTIIIGNILYIGILPFSYDIVIIAVYIVLILLMLYISLSKKKKIIINILINIFATLFLLLLSLGFTYMIITNDFINDITNLKDEVSKYELISYDDNTEIYLIGVYKSNHDDYNKAINDIQIKYNAQIQYYEDIESLINDFKVGNIKHIFISLIDKELLIEEEILTEDLVIKDNVDVITKTEEVNQSNVTYETFNIYLSGIDTYGDIMTKSRSDVNMVISVNPNSNEILLVNIPRDYYVTLANLNTKDKLTHAGIYGITESEETIESLLGINIDYNIRVNFNSLIEVIDAIGGVNVYSEYAFNTYGLEVKSGYNYFNGEETLKFSRARMNFYDGDRQRGKNQQAVIEAVINKITTDDVIITNYANILQLLSESFQTNMSSENIIKLINTQISSMKKWNIESYSLNGTDSGVTTKYGTYMYVMLPDYNTVYEAKRLIEANSN